MLVRVEVLFHRHVVGSRCRLRIELRELVRLIAHLRCTLLANRQMPWIMSGLFGGLHRGIDVGMYRTHAGAQ